MEGQAVPDGLLSEKLGSRIFALGSYVGEVIIRAYDGTWRVDDNDPEGELNIGGRSSERRNPLACPTCHEAIQEWSRR